MEKLPFYPLLKKSQVPNYQNAIRGKRHNYPPSTHNHVVPQVRWDNV